MFPRESPYLPILKVVLAALAAIALCQFVPWGVWIIIGAAALAVLAFVGFVLVTVASVQWRNWFSPRRSAPAMVLRKWTREYDMDLLDAEPTGFGPLLGRFSPPTTTIYLIICSILAKEAMQTQWVFWVSFLVNGGEIDFSVPESTYINLTEGMQGLLTSKGERFITFRPGPD